MYGVQYVAKSNWRLAWGVTLWAWRRGTWQFNPRHTTSTDSEQRSNVPTPVPLIDLNFSVRKASLHILYEPRDVDILVDLGRGQTSLQPLYPVPALQVQNATIVDELFQKTRLQREKHE
jgi:hypothetical protein